VLEAQAADGERAVADAAGASQMHRWASFAYGKDSAEITEAEARRIAAILLGWRSRLPWLGRLQRCSRSGSGRGACSR
jgi:hypothetical protein